MYILGISCYYHDSAAVLIKDGIVVAAAEEERFSRKKHDSSFPKLAIDFCLRKAKINANDLSYVVFYEKPFLKFERLLETYLEYAPRGFFSFQKAITAWLREKLWIPESVRRICIYADNDANSEYDGQASAFILARRLKKEDKKGEMRDVEVFVPKVAGKDWADVCLYRLVQEKEAA